MSPLLKPLAWALLGGGLAAVTTAGAIDLPWLHRPAAAVAATVATPSTMTVAAAPLVALLPGSTPNYRAIVQQYGPAVVGVTVEGSRPADEADADAPPRLFRGLPGAPGRPETAAGGRPGAGHRRALRPDADGHRRHRQRHRPRAAGRRRGALHPDRRGGEPGQLGRPAVRCGWQRGGHQCADLLAHRRLPGRELCDPRGRGDAREPADRGHRPCPARPPGRRSEERRGGEEGRSRGAPG